MVFPPIPSPSSCPHCPHCCARPHSAPAPSSHLANPKCLNMYVRPLTRALRRFRGCHVPAGPVRRAPSRCARPAIELTIARCDNTSSWAGVQFPQLGGRPTTIDHDGAESCGGAASDRSGQRARHSAARRKKNRCHRVNNKSWRGISVSGAATRGGEGSGPKRGVHENFSSLHKSRLCTREGMVE